MRAQATNPIAFTADPVVSESDGMMAGSDIYRRIQSKPKKSALPYIVSALAVIAVGAGAGYYLEKAPTQSPSPYAQSPAGQAVAQQQTKSAAQQATAAASDANTSANAAIAANDRAQTNAVEASGQPPANPDKAPSNVKPASHRVHQLSGQVIPTATSAGANGDDASAYRPAPVNPAAMPTPTQAQPATAVQAPAAAAVSPAAPQDATPHIQTEPQAPAQPAEQPQVQPQPQSQP